MVKFFRKRYIAIRLIPMGQISGEAVLKAISDSLPSNVEKTEVDLRLLDYDQSKGLGILRCKHRALGVVRTSISTVKDIRNVPVVVKVVGVSGTIRSLRSKFLRS